MLKSLDFCHVGIPVGLVTVWFLDLDVNKSYIGLSQRSTLSPTLFDVDTVNITRLPHVGVAEVSPITMTY